MIVVLRGLDFDHICWHHARTLVLQKFASLFSSDSRSEESTAALCLGNHWDKLFLVRLRLHMSRVCWQCSLMKRLEHQLRLIHHPVVLHLSRIPEAALECAKLILRLRLGTVEHRLWLVLGSGKCVVVLTTAKIWHNSRLPRQRLQTLLKLILDNSCRLLVFIAPNFCTTAAISAHSYPLFVLNEFENWFAYLSILICVYTVFIDFCYMLYIIYASPLLLIN